MVTCIETLRCAPADVEELGIGWHAWTAETTKELGRLANLRKLSLKLDSEFLMTPRESDGKTNWDELVGVLNGLEHLTDLDVDGLPLACLPDLLKVQHVKGLWINSFSAQDRVSTTEGQPVPESYWRGLKCIGAATHLTGVGLPAPVDWITLRAMEGLPQIKSIRIGGARLVQTLNGGLTSWPSLRDLRYLEVGDTHDWSTHLLSEVVGQSGIEVLKLGSASTGIQFMHGIGHGPSGPRLLQSKESDEAPALRELSISGCVGNNWIEGYGADAYFLDIGFYGESVRAPTGEMHVSGLRVLQRLESLSLGEFLNARIDLLFESCSKLPKLRTLRVTSCPGVSVPDDFRQLVTCAALEELDLSGCRNLTDDCMRVIADIPRLTRLSINGCHRITAVGIGHLMRAKSLRALSWSGAPHADDAAALMIVKHLTALDELHLDDLRSPMGDVGRKAIADRKGWRVLTLPNHQAPRPASANAGSWTWNDANGHGWSDELIAMLAGESPGLEHLRVGGNGISGKGFQSLAACAKLGKIELVGGVLNPDTAKGLAFIPSLRWLAADLPRAYTMRNDPPETVKSRTEAREAIALAIKGVRGEKGLLLTGSQGGSD